jgi:hypothetical protein
MTDDPLQDSMKTKWRGIGKTLALFGLDSWRDNYVNELSANKLSCAGEKDARKLSIQDAALLHLKVQTAGELTLYNQLNINELLNGEKRLGHFESPLHTECEAGKKEKQQR